GPRSEDRGYRCCRDAGHSRCAASMGPRSEDRGYPAFNVPLIENGSGFNGSTVRGPWLSRRVQRERNDHARSFNGSTVRGPWLSRHLSHRRRRMASFNGSTVRGPWLSKRKSSYEQNHQKLQWVHGPRTVVISHYRAGSGAVLVASMGPRSEDRG